MSESTRRSGFGSAVVDAGVVARVYLGRIERHDPALHAFADLDAAAALAAAALLRTQAETVSEGLRGLLAWGAGQSAGWLGSARRELRDGRMALQTRLDAVAPGAGLLLPVVPCASFGFDEPQPQIAIFRGPRLDRRPGGHEPADGDRRRRHAGGGRSSRRTMRRHSRWPA